MTDELEQRLRSSLQAADLPPVPDSLRNFLVSIPAARRRPQPQPRLATTLRLAAGLAAIVVAIGALAFSFSLQVPPATSPAATSSPSPNTPPSPTTTLSPATPTPSVSSSLPAVTSTPSASAVALEWAEPVRISAGLTGFPTERDLSVAVDDSGVVHVAASVYDGVIYLTNRGGSWSETRVSTAPDEGRDGEVSLALDDGTAWIAFTRWTSFEPCVFGCDSQPPGELEGIFLVDNRTGDWTDPRLLVAGGMSDPSLAVRGGRFHLASSGAPSNEFRGVHYLTDAAGSQTAEQVAAGGSDAHLQLGSDGRPRILFLDEDGLRLATGTDSTGSFEVVDGPSGTNGARDPALALDGGDRVWAAWNASDDLAVHVSIFHGAGDWRTEEILRGASLGGFDVDAEGNVHVVTLPLFLDDRLPDILGGVWYASNRTGDFVVEQLRSFRSDVDGGGTFPSAIAVDRDGRPHIVFRWLEARGADGLDYVVASSR